MNYREAVAHATKQQEKVADFHERINELWTEGKTTLAVGHGEKFVAVFTRQGNLLDVTLCADNQPVGFISIKNNETGVYSIVNDTMLNPHPTFTNLTGHGLEVKAAFRKRGIGAALLSLGLGLAQRHYREEGTGQTFTLLATDITKSGLGCYRNFGFRIEEGMSVSSGSYTEAAQVPAIKILRRKAPWLRRLLKRLDLG